MSTTTTTAEHPTWTGPTWATDHKDTEAGIRWARRATTTVTTATDGAVLGEPVNVEAETYDFLSIVDNSVIVERHPVQIFVGGDAFDIPGAHDLIAALTELVEAVKDGTP